MNRKRGEKKYLEEIPEGIGCAKDVNLSVLSNTWMAKCHFCKGRGSCNCAIKNVLGHLSKT